MRTAEESYIATMQARRHHVLACINEAVLRCEFDVVVHKAYMYKELEKELVDNGYVISCTLPNAVKIDWSSPGSKKIFQ